MGDEQEPTEPPVDAATDAPRSEESPAESAVARGNVHSRKHDEPELPPPPPLPH